MDHPGALQSSGVRGLSIVRRLRQQNGSSLVEIMLGVSLMVVVMGALMGPMIVSAHSQARDVNFAQAQDQARAGLDRMVAEIRQATAVLASGPNFVQMNVSLHGTAYVVDYECDIAQTGTAYRECLRVQAPAGSALPSLSGGAPIITNLLNGTPSSPVFSWGPDPVAPYYMTATLSVPASGGNSLGLTHAVVFSDGATMRNLNVGN